MSTYPTEIENLVEDDHQRGNSPVDWAVENESDGSIESESTSRRSRRRHRDKSVDRRRSAKRARKGAKDIPEFKEFKKAPGGDQLGRFMDWMAKVNRSLGFAPHWGERARYDYFLIKCGDELDDIIQANNLLPHEDSRVPYTRLITNIAEHFRGRVDPTIDLQEFWACRQEPGEAVQDFHLRLARLARHKPSITPELLKLHFVNSLRDDYAKNFAATANKSLEETVQLAIRHEAFKSRQTSVRELSEIQVANVVVADSQPPALVANIQHGGAQPCPNCGIVNHRYGKCPAIGKLCINCNRPGHFASVCRQPRKPKRGPETAHRGKKRREINKVIHPE
jgi:hypothetical protein